MKYEKTISVFLNYTFILLCGFANSYNFTLAEHQSYLLGQLKESFPLSEKENQVLMRGRNAVTRSKNRRNPAAYQDSTAFEALIGYIYITDKNRCQELLAWLESAVDIREKDGGKS